MIWIFIVSCNCVFSNFSLTLDLQNIKFSKSRTVEIWCFDFYPTFTSLRKIAVAYISKWDKNQFHIRLYQCSFTNCVSPEQVKLLFFKWAIPVLFFFIFVLSILLTVKKMSDIKVCRWLDWNRRSLTSEATTPPTEPQPLPSNVYLCCQFVIKRKFVNHKLSQRLQKPFRRKKIIWAEIFILNSKDCH